MPGLQTTLRPYLQIIDSVSMQLSRVKQLLNDPNSRLIDSDPRFLIGGQLGDLAEDFASLAKEIEQPEPEAPES